MKIRQSEVLREKKKLRQTTIARTEILCMLRFNDKIVLYYITRTTAGNRKKSLSHYVIYQIINNNIPRDCR